MAENGVFSLSEVNVVAPVRGGLRRTPFDVRGKSILIKGRGTRFWGPRCSFRDVSESRRIFSVSPGLMF